MPDSAAREGGGLPDRMSCESRDASQLAPMIVALWFG